VLVDEEDRRYFKQQEITLWRKALKPSRRKEISSLSEEGEKLESKEKEKAKEKPKE